MSKYPGFEKVKIVKKCEEEKEGVGIENDCKDFNFENENFLENVDDDILYVDGSLKVKGVDRIQEIQSDEKCEASASNLSKPPDCFSDPPLRLNMQMSLPLCDIQQLSFYETFIISKEKAESSVRAILPIVPSIDSVDEVGSSSIVVEEMEDGNILIFMMQQVFDNDERTILEILSVNSKDLKLIHEKRIERKCGQNESKKVRKFQTY